jgi:hypothetical protein
MYRNITHYASGTASVPFLRLTPSKRSAFCNLIPITNVEIAHVTHFVMIVIAPVISLESVFKVTNRRNNEAIENCVNRCQ